MLKAIAALSQYAKARGLTDSARQEKEDALLKALLHPVFALDDEDGASVLAIYAHGPTATRAVMTEAAGPVVEIWHPSHADWIEDPGFEPELHALHEYAWTRSGPQMTAEQLRSKWAAIDKAESYFISMPGSQRFHTSSDSPVFESRHRFAEFWYDQQAVRWGYDNENPWQHLTLAGDLAFLHGSIPPEAWDEKTREKVQTTLSNLQLTWGEITPSSGIVIGDSNVETDDEDDAFTFSPSM
jgi:hypothetical protein